MNRIFKKLFVIIVVEGFCLMHIQFNQSALINNGSYVLVISRTNELDTEIQVVGWFEFGLHGLFDVQLNTMEL